MAFLKHLTITLQLMVLRYLLIRTLTSESQGKTRKQIKPLPAYLKLSATLASLFTAEIIKMPPHHPPKYRFSQFLYRIN